jgi:hypothetical protein|tara:strand:- start:176 stop:892 length:717 start_codon:yes stop_codon:yes gene_type:complete
MSQVGKPFCQLHAEKLGWEKLPEVNSFKIKMLYGDMTEVIAVALLLAAGIEIVDLNKRVLLNTEAGDISGELDLIIRDGNSYSLWDIKSASKFAFEKKFESYQALKDNDDFGYLEQLYGYTKAERTETPDIKAGGWIAINKESGEMKVVPADPDDEDQYTTKINNTITKYLEADETNFERCFEDEPETFYRKLTGNRKLHKTCTYCSFRYTCWPNLVYAKNPRSKSATAYNYYTVFKD